MINRIHAHLHRPEKGWDPVPAEHVRSYGEAEWRAVDETLLDELGSWVGGYAGKRVLDLGGGPGQYSAAFARRGARVTWHDVSRRYLDMAKEKIGAQGLDAQVHFSLGYLDEAPRLLFEPFDLVFNRICWNYGIGDASFADLVYRLARPGGWIYVDTHHSGARRGVASRSVRVRTWLNDQLAIKIGHPYPPHGRVARLFQRYPLRRLIVDYRLPENDRVLLQKSVGRI